MALRTVGTTPVLLLNENPKRTRVEIQMQSTNVDSANTGKLFLTPGQQPVSTVGHPSQGEVLVQGAAISRPAAGEKLPEVWKKAIWAVADTAAQTLTVEEQTEQ